MGLRWPPASICLFAFLKQGYAPADRAILAQLELVRRVEAVALRVIPEQTGLDALGAVQDALDPLIAFLLCHFLTPAPARAGQRNLALPGITPESSSRGPNR